MKWKNIPNFDGVYQVSDSGAVRSVHREITDSLGRTYRVRGRYLSMNETVQGYPAVSLHNRKTKKTRNHRVHRLVAECFDLKGTGPHINHIDGKKWNNSINNLEWCTPKENTLHAIKLGLLTTLGETHHRAKLSAQDVLDIRGLLSFGEKGKDIAKLYGVTPQIISDIKRMKTWKSV